MNVNITKKIIEQYTEFMYPNMWKGIIPNEILFGDELEEFQITNLYNLQYLQHRNCKKIKSANQLTILIAGCGTGESSLEMSRHYKEAKFTYLDISPASLNQCRLYSEQLGIDNISFVLGNIAAIDLEKEFDIIISTGVIHHLSEPSVGIANLKKHLNEDGLMAMMVYGEYGRYEVGLFQNVLKIALNNEIDFQKGIKLVKEILKSVTGSSRLKNMIGMDDIEQGEQHIVDIILNVNENRYNVKSLLKMMDSGGMRVTGFGKKSDYDPSLYISRNTSNEHFSELEYFEKAHIAELLNGQISKHDYYAVKAENAFIPYTISSPNIDNLVPWMSPYISHNEGITNSIKMKYIHFLMENRNLILDENASMVLKLINGKNSIGEIKTVLYDKLEPNDITAFLEGLIKQDAVFLHKN